MGSSSGDALPARTALALRIHLLWCRHCRAYRWGLALAAGFAQRLASTSPVEPEEVDTVAAAVRNRALEEARGENSASAG